jgi:hypothetical protein
MKIASAWKTSLRDETGTVLVIAALSLTALLGFGAMAIDIGVMFYTRRNVQIAADAAAVAGTLDYLYNSSVSSAKTAALAGSSVNGFTNGSDGTTVTVNIPPASGPNTANAGSVEAVVSYPRTTFLMGLFGFQTVTVSARAVAGTVPGQTCIWAMATSGTGLKLKGSYDIEATNCGIYVNSPSGDAIKITGNGGTVNARYVDVVGNATGNHTTNPTPDTVNAAPQQNPWGNLPGPTEANGGCTTIDTSTTSITGTVAGPGLNSAVCYQKAVTLNGATMGPGVYMFENGVTISGTVTVNGGTLDVYGGTFNQPSNTLVNVTAPTSGTYSGIAIMQPSNNTNQLQVQFGSNNQTLDGYIYAPGAEVFLQDNGGGTTATGIVASDLYDNSSTIRIPSYDAAHPTTTLNRVATLVE